MSLTARVFENLTKNQRKLVVQIVEHLATGNYSSEFWAASAMKKGWFIVLQGVGGAENKEVTGFEETDLLALKDEGYIMLVSRNVGYVGSVKPKAENQYALLKSTTGAVVGGTIGPKTMNEDSLDPWGPIQSLLFESDSDIVVEIVGLAGLTPTWSLTERQDYSHPTRKRAYKPQVQAAYEELHPEQRLRFVLNVAREIVRRDPRKEERLKDALRRTGWSLVAGNLIPLAVMALEDLEQVPNAAHKDLSKAADRLGHDLTGAISAACGAVDSLTAEIYESYGLGDVGRSSFQERVSRSTKAVGALDRLERELLELNWKPDGAKTFCQNLKGAINQAAFVMQTLRSEMGDVHGSKSVLATLAFDSIKWATIICSLLKQERKS